MSNLVPLQLATLRVFDQFDCDLYLNDAKLGPRLYRSKGIAVSSSDLDALCKRGITVLYADEFESRKIRKQLREDLETILKNEDISQQDRFGLLQTAVSAEIHQAFRLINVNAAVERSLDIGEKIAQLLSGGETLPGDLFNVVQHDFYTFTHVTNVAGYVVLLAERMGITDPVELNAIATGALLHDLGKRMISPAILNKNGRLSEEDWNVIKSHPQRGYEELHDRQELTHGQLMMVYQHHEKLDGSGYPVRAFGDDIHPWARLCTVVDIFDAMSCQRPYRKAIGLSAVLNRLERMAATQLDRDMVSCWISTMKAIK